MKQDHQLNEWLLGLDDLQTEHLRLNNQLSDKLQQVLSPAVLERIEQLQTELLNHEAAISLLRHDLTVQLKIKRPLENKEILLWKDEEKAGLNIEKMKRSWQQLLESYSDILNGS